MAFVSIFCGCFFDWRDYPGIMSTMSFMATDFTKSSTKTSTDSPWFNMKYFSFSGTTYYVIVILLAFIPQYVDISFLWVKIQFKKPPK